MNQILRSIAEQINAKELKFAKFQLLGDEDKLQVTVKKGSKFMEIHYNECMDLYEVTFGRIKRFEVFRDKTLDSVYYDQLKPMIQDYFKFEYVMDQFIRR